MSLLHDKDTVAGLSGTPKAMFIFGFVSGIGTAAVVGLIVILSMLMSGKSLAWAGGTNTNNNAPTAPSAPTNPNQPTPPVGAPVKPVDEKTDHIRGNKNAKVTLIEYSDFECPFCLRHLDTINQILAQYPNDVRLIYRHYPLTSIHPEAQKAAEASECAGAQGKFWEMHDKIFAANAAGTMNVQKWKDAAKELSLDTNKFNKCLDGGEMAARVNQDTAEGSSAGVSGTPATFVNGQLVEGAVPFANFQTILQQQGAQS